MNKMAMYRHKCKKQNMTMPVVTSSD